MVLWLITSLFDYSDPQKNWSGKINERYNEFLLLKDSILSIQSVLLLFFLHTTLHKHKKVSLFFTEYTIKVVRKVSCTDHNV